MRRLLLAAAVLLPALAFAQAEPGGKKEPPKKGAAKTPPADPDAYAKSLASDSNVCGAICMDELDIMLFGGMITVPFNRPSVEQCGIWMSGTPQSRAAEQAGRRKEADDEASKNRYSPRERDELRKRKTEPLRKCEAEFKRRCEEVRKSIPVETRKKAVDNAKKEIGNVLEESRRAVLEGYLANVLAGCSLHE
jgi:hypothetical protein